MNEEGREKKKRSWKRIMLRIVALVLVAALSGGVVYVVMDQKIQATAPYAKLLEAMQLIENEYIGDVDTDAVMDGAIDGMLTGLGDRWSYYVSLDEMAEHMENVNNSYVGIGVTVTKAEGEGLVIEVVTAGSGAEEAGLVPGDVILAADGTDLLNMELDEAKQLVKGEEGSFVSLTIQHADGTQEEVSVQRRTVEVETVYAEQIGEIGYISIANFNQGVAEHFIEAVDTLIEQGVQSLVFDVRFNGGGRLTELMDMLDYLLPEGLLFSSEDNTGTKSSVYSDESCVELPMAVLVNDNTFSAAEFFAEALREYDWAVIVGQHTTGKGYSQSTLYLSDGSAVVLSTKAYYTPEGKSLANVGIEPDVSVDLSDEDYYKLYLGQLDHADDEQLQQALKQVQAEMD